MRSHQMWVQWARNYDQILEYLYECADLRKTNDHMKWKALICSVLNKFESGFNSEQIRMNSIIVVLLELQAFYDEIKI